MQINIRKGLNETEKDLLENDVCEMGASCNKIF